MTPRYLRGASSALAIAWPLPNGKGQWYATQTFVSGLSLLLVVMLGFCQPALTQAKQPAGGTITGHVFFADNDRPARFASIYLKPITPSDSTDDFFTALMDSAIVNMQRKGQEAGVTTAEDQSELSSARSAAKGFMTNISDAMLSATIGADGSYVFRDVPPGAYFLHVKASGYIDPLAQFSNEELASQDAEMRKKIAAVVDHVAVVGTEQVREDLRLTRGGVVSGRLLYDDGSPATGWKVRAIPRKATDPGRGADILGIDLSQLPIGQAENRTVTDDTGRFRIAGLPSGKFILEAKLTTAALSRTPFEPVSSHAGSFLSILGGLSGMGELRFTVYSGSTARWNDAEEIMVHAGEEYAGTDIVVSLNSVHSIAGSVLSVMDGHTVNDGNVELIAQDSSGKDDPSLRLSASIQADGTFRFDCVPGSGNYILRARHAGDTTITSEMKLLGSTIAERKTNRSYAAAETTIALKNSDITGVRLFVGDASPTSPRSK